MGGGGKGGKVVGVCGVLLTMSNQEPFGNVSRSQAHVAVGGRRSAIAHEPICEKINGEAANAKALAMRTREKTHWNIGRPQRLARLACDTASSLALTGELLTHLYSRCRAMDCVRETVRGNDA